MSLKHGIAACALLILTGVALRVPGLTDPPLDFHPTRQYRAAIIARGYALDLLHDRSPAERDIAAAASGTPPIEPPLMERAAAFVYHAIGREDLAWARGLAVLAWSLGGVALAWLALQLLRPIAAVVAVAVWTFLPFSIAASRSFQPDPLMTSLVVFTLAAAVDLLRRVSTRSALIAAAGIASALLVKAMALFFLFPPLAALILLAAAPARKKAIAVAVAAVSSVPAIWYYARLPLATAYGPFFQLLGEPEFWRGWAAMIAQVVTWPAFILALVGSICAPRPLRALLAAAFAGYVAFGIVFTHHIHTHNYYSLPIVPFVALGVAALVDAAARRFTRAAPMALAAIVVIACVVGGSMSVLEAESSSRRAALRAEAARLERIGTLVGHSRRVLALDGAYALPLIYHGFVMASTWPLSGDLAILPLTGGSAGPAQARLRDSGAEFFVCTVQPELDAQPDLSGLLAQQHPLIERDGAPERWAYVIYDVRRGVLSLDPSSLSLYGRVGAPDGFERRVSLYAPAGSQWTATVAPGSILTVDPATGTGPGTLRIHTGTPTAAVDRTEQIKITSTKEDPVVLNVRVRAEQGPDRPPIGFVDAPPDPISAGAAPIVVQGWALDDVSLASVWVGYVDAQGAIVRLGAARRGGRRPDVAASYADFPDLDRAAWSFTLPAASLPPARPLELRFIADDGAGQRTVLGVRHVR